MINFDYRTKDGKISTKYSAFLDKLDFDPAISEHFGAALIDLNGFVKLISLCNGKVNEISVGTDDGLSLFANFPMFKNGSKRAGMSFNISDTAIEKNPRQCMTDRKYIFNQCDEKLERLEIPDAVKMINGKQFEEYTKN